MTINDLVATGGHCIGLSYFANFASTYNVDYGCKLWGADGVILEKKNDTQIILRGFFDGESDFLFTLTDDNGVETTDGTQLRYNYDEVAVNGTGMSLVTGIAKPGGSGYNFGKGNGSSLYWIGKINYTAPGEYEVTFDIPVAYLSAYDNANGGNIVDHYKLESYVANATAQIERLPIIVNPYYGTYKYGDIVNETYPLRVDIDRDNNTVTFTNFGGHGYAIDSNCNYQKVSATFDPETGKITFPETPVPMVNLPLWNYSGSGLSAMYNFQLRTIDTSKALTYDDMYGQLSEDHAQHNDAPNAWVTNGGTRRTFEPSKITLNPYTFSYPGIIYGQMNYTDPIESTVIDMSNDVTVDVEIHDMEFSRNDDGTYCVQGEINTSANHKYVDHYELYMVSGKYDNITTSDFIADDEAGHASGVSLLNISPENDEYVISRSTKAAADDNAGNVRTNDYKFNKTLNADNSALSAGNDSYSFYLKTVYKPVEYNNETFTLSPTFHALTSFGPSDITAINDIEADDATPEIYNMQGMRVSETTPGSIYLIRKGSTVTKFIAR